MILGGGRPEDLIMHCYHLARHYHVDPEVFLRKPLSEVLRHIHWTQRMESEISAEQEMQERTRR